MDFSRQRGILSAADTDRYPITIYGLGGVGSWTALVLAKCGFATFRGCDHDAVAPENDSQAFLRRHVGRAKSAAVREVLELHRGITPAFERRAITPDERPTGIVIGAVDSMTARRTIWEAIAGSPSVPLFLDARIGGEEGRLYALVPSNPLDAEAYAAPAVLHSDAEGSTLPCGEEAIAYTLTLMATLIAKRIQTFLRGESVPFETIYSLGSESWLLRDARGEVIATTKRR